MNRIIEAVRYATEVHYGDLRKFCGEKYIYHPLRVMNEALMHPKLKDEKYVLAAVCHDIIEDHPEPTPEDAYSKLAHVIGVEAAIVVGELTNRYTSEQYPDLNRAHRKRLERDRLAACSDEVKILKMLDRIDNLKSFDFEHLVAMSPENRKKAMGFAKVYSKESRALFRTIGHADPDLMDLGLIYVEDLE